jgi:hypothetical protein
VVVEQASLFARQFDDGIRASLAALGPRSDSDVIKTRREAFPDLLLAEHGRAVGDWKANGLSAPPHPYFAGNYFDIFLTIISIE